MSVRVISDAPANLVQDCLLFHRYVQPIVAMLTDPETETPLTIGILGTWGSGKSTVLSMVGETLKQRYAESVVCVDFNPWVHRREPNMLVPLLHTLNDELARDQDKFLDALKNVGRVLFALGADLLLKNMTADVVSLKSLSEASEAVATQKGLVESKMRQLRKTLQDVAFSVRDQGAKLVFFVDDLDRCQPDQIIDVLESIKLFLDVKNVFVLLAVDKEVVDRGVQWRFRSFEFGDRNAAIGAEYLEKIIQVPITLFPLQVGQVGNYILALKPAELVISQLALLREVLAPNPRKIKRIVNVLNVIDAVAQQMPLLKLDPGLLARLVVIQVQSPSLYQDVVTYPVLLGALEQTYQQIKFISREEDFREYQRLAGTIHKLCTKHHESGSYLTQIFSKSDFKSLTIEQCKSYLSMLGG